VLRKEREGTVLNPGLESEVDDQPAKNLSGKRTNHAFGQDPAEDRFFQKLESGNL
jgi:hypothetical protein